MIVITVNGGSTSVKLAAFRPSGEAAPSFIDGAQYSAGSTPAGYLRAFAERAAPKEPVAAVAHRIVHGGMRLVRPVRIDASTEAEIASLAPLAPLHIPPALEWIHIARESFGPEVAQVAVFDTAYFADLPRVAAEYAIPSSLGLEAGVRRYGFHGLAHEAMWRRWSEKHPEHAAHGRIITLQLGGGCSIAAIDRGRPVDTSMGFSPLEGLVMATRSGDIDPTVVTYLAERFAVTPDEILHRLTRESGLLGVSGRSADVSRLLEDPSPQAQFAIELYCYRARKYVGAYLAVLGGCDGIVFSGGVGEHVPHVRARILDSMEWAGIALDPAANAAATGGEAGIDAASSRVSVDVLPADEALSLALAATKCLSS